MGARGAEEFEEGALAEQVEVGGVGVVGGEIAVASFPAPGPLAIEAGDGSFEESGGAALPLQLPEKVVVNQDQDSEGCTRHEHPRDR